MTSSLLTGLRLKPLTVYIGAEIEDIDVSRIEAEQVEQIKNALAKYHLITFRNQNITREEHVVFAQKLGDLTPAHPVYPGTLDEHPEIHKPGLFPDRGGAIRWGDWHTDLTCLEQPPSAAVLRITELPEVGGDTTFASTQDAYDRLSAPIRDALDGLVAVHDGVSHFGSYLDAHGPREWEGAPLTQLVSEHPLVRVHPENGRKGLFVNPGFTTRIKGLSRLESDRLLSFLYEHITLPEHVVRWRWAAGDILIWDNRATMHYAIADHGQAPRVVERITISGERPFGVPSSL